MKDRKEAIVHLGDPRERWREIISAQGAGHRTARKRSLLLKSAFLRCQFIFGVGISRSRQFGLVPLLDLRLFDV